MPTFREGKRVDYSEIKFDDSLKIKRIEVTNTEIRFYEDSTFEGPICVIDRGGSYPGAGLAIEFADGVEAGYTTEDMLADGTPAY